MSGSAPAPKKKRRWLRRTLISLGVGIPIVGLALWIAIHRVEWLGPWLADTGRAIVGNDAIAWLEDTLYGVEDKYNLATKGDQAPTAHWEVPAEEPASPPKPDKALLYPVFTPKNVEPMHASFAAPGDGKWVAMSDPHNPGEAAPLFKTLLHPDKKRGWAHVAIVAVDLRQVRLHLVAGLHEPMTKLPEAKAQKRTGLIAEADLPRALAAFNGGFKTTHGNYGMKAEGVLWVEPRGRSCTVAMYEKDALKIQSWEAIEASRDSMTWFRQTPMCMYENGEMHKGLTVEENTHWGSTLDKDTVIRRSAVGLDETGGILFVGISEATTATAIAKAMNHAGAVNVAQLDVNWSFPKLVTIEADGKVKAIIDGFEYTDEDYVKKPMSRDFFYLTRKDPIEIPRAAP
jgi:hypothetical protein